ncbi:hypothetical protein [Bdellovibrio svalbardensis]|uniref:Uncharacterized protein n=1 Tax=Bdellovibrio svalbardensis TaxID=2972972 RepID=A0ABT6DL57_9BACT|nr:hypothetical protein [Bdellovibrio svalbardensis]MDG0817602.1 hypothetical protein [Bdellovibrio svalbardensis]
MYSELGEFALRQIVSSLVVVGPLLIIIAGFNFVFNQSRKLVMIYFVSGLVLTAVGAINLYRQFSARGGDDPSYQSSPLAPDGAREGKHEGSNLDQG